MEGTAELLLILVGGLGAALSWGRPREAILWSLAAFAYAGLETLVLGRGGIAVFLQAATLALVCGLAAGIGRRDSRRREGESDGIS